MSPRGRLLALVRHPIFMLYAFGDIHGDLEKLDELLESMPLEQGDRLVFLGDYID
jgi:predicted phosphodiesterase